MCRIMERVSNIGIKSRIKQFVILVALVTLVVLISKAVDAGIIQ